MKKIPLNAIQKAYVSGRNSKLSWGGRSCQMCVVTDRKDVDPVVLKETMRIMEENHPVLRAYVHQDQWLVFGDRFSDFPIVTEEEPEALKRRLISETLPLNGPLYGAYVAGKERRLVVIVDMIISDATSMYILMDDIKGIYDALKDGADPKALTKEVNYDKILPLEQSKAEECDSFQIAANLLPNKIYHSEESPYPLTHREHVLDRDAWKQFQQIARDCGIDPVSALLSIYGVCLGGCGLSDKITFNMTVSRRDAAKGPGDAIYDYTDVVYVSVPTGGKRMLDCAMEAKKAKREALKNQLGKSTDILRNVMQKDPINGYSPYVFTCTTGLGERIGKAAFLKEGSGITTCTPQVILDEQIYEKEGGIVLCWDSVDEAFCIRGMVEKLFSELTSMMDRASVDHTFWLSRADFPETETIYQEAKAVAAIAQGNRAVNYLSEEGIEVFPDSGKLKYRAQKGKMTEKRKSFLKKYKEYILEYFNYLGGSHEHFKEDIAF